MAEEMEETIAPPQAATIARQGYTTEVYFSESLLIKSQVLFEEI